MASGKKGTSMKDEDACKALAIHPDTLKQLKLFFKDEYSKHDWARSKGKVDVRSLPNQETSNLAIAAARDAFSKHHGEAGDAQATSETQIHNVYFGVFRHGKSSVERHLKKVAEGKKRKRPLEDLTASPSPTKKTRRSNDHSPAADTDTDIDSDADADIERSSRLKRTIDEAVITATDDAAARHHQSPESSSHIKRTITEAVTTATDDAAARLCQSLVDAISSSDLKRTIAEAVTTATNDAAARHHQSPESSSDLKRTIAGAVTTAINDAVARHRQALVDAIRSAIPRQAIPPISLNEIELHVSLATSSELSAQSNCPTFETCVPCLGRGDRLRSLTGIREISFEKLRYWTKYYVPALGSSACVSFLYQDPVSLLPTEITDDTSLHVCVATFLVNGRDTIELSVPTKHATQ
ncbi:hypothetical protein SLS55_002847 [Diplodia seriata]|uniref:Uncharacterized protein n=1 Tax=Diplodia seriata TaxID=420778 RepID=A0ABR3CLA8_9PEZI